MSLKFKVVFSLFFVFAVVCFCSAKIETNDDVVVSSNTNHLSLNHPVSNLVFIVSDVIIDKESRIFMSLDSVLLNGKHQFYFTDSIIAIDASFVEGKLDGSAKFYYRNGILSEQGFWINESKEGKYLTFWNDGTISSNQIYKDDKLQGESLSYWQDGSLYMKRVFDNGVELNHIWYDKDSTLVEDMSLIDNLKRSLEKYIIQDYIDNSDSGLNWVKIEEDEILINCHCIANTSGDLNNPISGNECSHGTNPWSEKGVAAYLIYPDVPVLVGDVNKDGIDDYIINYTIEGMGGGNMWINNNVLIINNGLELLSVAKFQGNVKYSSINNELESISDKGVVTIEVLYDSSRVVKSTDTVSHKYIESSNRFEKIKSKKSYVQIDNILTIYKNELVESDLSNEIILKGMSLLSELKYCRVESDSLWNGLTDELAGLLSVCQNTDSYRVHFLKPNYLIIQAESAGFCGSGGCHIDVFQYTDGIFRSLDKSNFSTLLSKESTNEYIIESKSEKINGGRCNSNYKRKFYVNSDSIQYLEIYDVLHVINDTIAHKNFCLTN